MTTTVTRPLKAIETGFSACFGGGLVCLSPPAPCRGHAEWGEEGGELDYPDFPIDRKVNQVPETTREPPSLRGGGAREVLPPRSPATHQGAEKGGGQPSTRAIIIVTFRLSQSPFHACRNIIALYSACTCKKTA